MILGIPVKHCNKLYVLVDATYQEQSEDITPPIPTHCLPLHPALAYPSVRVPG